MKNNSQILVTGSAGFIGAALCLKLLNSGEDVIGIDNLNNYYDVNLKMARLDQIKRTAENKKGKFLFYKKDIENFDDVFKILKKHKPFIIFHFVHSNH